MMKKKQIFISGMLVWLFAVAGTSMVSITESQTHDRIIENERKALLRILFELIEPSRFNNKLTDDIITLPASPLLGNTEPQVAYRARKDNKNVAIIFNTQSNNGYNGAINLLVAVNIDGTIAGVRAVKHNETPGLGDLIDIKKSNWITQFNFKSLLNPNSDKLWSVKKDVGVFDQMTGATITPRALVTAVHDTLKYYDIHKDTLFNRSEVKHEQQ